MRASTVGGGGLSASGSIKTSADPLSPAPCLQVTDWLKKVHVGTITNTPFDGQRGGPNQTITGWNVSEWRTALRRIQVRARRAAQGGVKRQDPISARLAIPIHLLPTAQGAAKEAGQPPILYGIDHLHGANYVMGATLFPQQINVAASFDRAHAETMGRVMAKVGCWNRAEE